MSQKTLTAPHHIAAPRAGWIAPLLDILTVLIPLLVIAFAGVFLGGSASGGASPLGALTINFAYLAAILIGGWVLRRRGSGWTEIGLGRPDSWWKTILMALGTMVAAAIVVIGVQIVALNLPGAEIAPVDETRFTPLVGNVSMLIYGVLAAWTTIAFGEEMFFRALLITKLQEVFASSKFATALAVAVSTVLFGAAHFAEGPLGLFSNGAFGLLQALIYLRTKKNLWVTVIAHAILNTVRFILIFYGA
jgi:CAAX protease family protein